MRAPILALAIMLTVCASPSQCARAVPHREGAPMDVRACNRTLASQAVEYRCSDRTCDAMPVLLSRRTPMCPESLQANGANGEATLRFVIDERGLAMETEVRSSTHPAFAAKAVEALQTWRFRPAMLEGKPVRRSAVQQFPSSLL